MWKYVGLSRRYKQEKEFNKNAPIFSDNEERSEYLKQEIENEKDEFIKMLLNKQLFIS